MFEFGSLPWLVVLLPLAGAAVNLCLGRFFPRFLINLIACGTVLGGFVLAVKLFLHIREADALASSLGSLLPGYGDSWIRIPGTNGFTIGMDLYVDRLSATMMLVVTGVGFLIHLYSTGYMAEEKRYSRYFGYLNLFTGFMLLLVLAKNLVLMFVGWEGVGLCSYLLIGFWFDDARKGVENSKAGMKAFVVNRVGDLAFTIGVLLLFFHVGTHFGKWTVDITEIKALIGREPFELAFWICLLLFLGATGKSAQIPLYTWLPDAMAGPTPVSALIHAATMVTAGVYMVSRMHFLYTLSPGAMTLVATVGAATALFAGTIGICQTDIKKVLAYSTVSQLGFMFLGCGSGAFFAGIFHVVTHAFFKACLFLGSGSVIMGCHHEQDVRKMGGLKRFMPVTYITFLIATLAIAGIPPFAGFFSKDEILWKTFTSETMVLPHWGKVLWGVGVAAAFCTAFYMFRLVFLTFFGTYRGGHASAIAHMGGGVTHGHGGGHEDPAGGEASHGMPKESPWTMTLPLVVLMLLSIGGGFLGMPHVFEKLGVPAEYTGIFERWLQPVFEQPPVHEKPVAAGHGTDVHHGAALEFGLMGVSVLIALAGIFVAANLYLWKPHRPAEIAQTIRGLYETVYNKYYVDELYEATFLRAAHAASDLCANFDFRVIDRTVDLHGRSAATWAHYTGYFDNEVIDGAVNGVSDTVWRAGQKVRTAQTGNIRTYVTLAVIGALFIIAFFCTYLLQEKIVSFLNRIFGGS